MSGHYEAPIREPLIIGHKTYHDITEDIARPIEERAGKLWWVSFWAALVLFIYGFGCIAYTIGTGIGAWGLNRTINWGWDITNFVWWVGIGHAGTLISAVLLLFRQRWRMSVNRSAEAMTIFAVVQAAIFPVIHMGRVWVGYWVFPLPNQFGSLWTNFNSPLLWDVFAISTYFSVSTVFWFMGLIPDFAMIRDRAKTPWTKKIYTFLAFGWGGKAKHWQRFEELSLVLAGLATPLVFSVHTTVSFDFATSVIKGWHSTIYHIEIMNIVIIVTGGMVTVAYAVEYFIGWYSGSRYEDFTYLSPGAATGPYWWAFWALIICNLVVPASFWFKKLRTNIIWTYFVALIINIGMWFERFDIIVINLSRDYLPGAWTMFKPTIIDVGVYLGTIGFFGVLFLLYARTFPVIAQAELKSILKISGETYKAKEGDEHDHH